MVTAYVGDSSPQEFADDHNALRDKSFGNVLETFRHIAHNRICALTFALHSAHFPLLQNVKGTLDI
jgi:hypothetical protein